MGGKAWSDRDIEFIRENIGVMTATDIGRKLGRSVSSVHHVIQNRGIAAPRGMRVPHREALYRLSGVMSAVGIAKVVNRAPRSVAQALQRTGMKARRGKPHPNHTHHQGVTIKWTPDEYRRLQEVLMNRYINGPPIEGPSFVAHEWFKRNTI